MTATLVARLDQLKSQKLPSGSGLIDDSPDNEVLYWAFIGKLSFPYDVVITNQLIASAEYIGSSVHTANHAWSNRSKEPCVIAFVLIAAKPLP